MPAETEPCELHEIINCGACKKRAPQLPADSRPFKAQYDDWCRECRLDVMEGDTILYRETPEWAGVIHVDCA